MDLKTFLKKVAGTVEEIAKSPSAPQRTSSSPSSAQQTCRPQPQPSYQESQPDRSDSEWMAYFRQILAEDFGQYTVREHVPVQELVGNVSDEFQLYATRPRQAYKAEWGKPYDFVLYEGDRVKGVIVIGKYQSQYKHVSFLIAKMYAKKMGVPFVSFYMDAPNEHDYVVNRIRSYVR